MVGLAGEAGQEQATGGALSAAEETKTASAEAPLQCGVSAPAWAAPQMEGVQGLSAPHRRLLRLLQKQLLLQLAANKRGADIDPRRRPPHAATPESILARWIAADPKRLVAGVLALGLHATSPSTVTGSTPGASQQLSSDFAVVGGEPTSHRHPPRAAAAALDTAAAPGPDAEARESQGSPCAAAATAATAAAVATDPLETYTTCSTTCSAASSTVSSTIGNGSNSSGVKSRSSNGSALSRKVRKFGGEAVRSPARNAEAAVAGSAKHQGPDGKDNCEGCVALRTSCVLCLSPFSSVGGSFLCGSCLHTLKNNRWPWTGEGRGGNTAKRSLSSIRNPPLKRTGGLNSSVAICSTHQPVQDHPDLCVYPSVYPSVHTAMQKPSRRLKRSTSTVSTARQQPQREDQQQQRGQQQREREQEQRHQQHEQQQQLHKKQQDDCSGSAGEHSEVQEGIGWRARAVAAAATAEDSNWWSSADSGGEPLVVPPLLLPLLPSIFCLHARPWPPPPTKRRRLLFRRRRGLDCFVPPSVAAQHPMWGSGFAQRERQGQQAPPANTAAPEAEAEAVCPDLLQLTPAPAVAKPIDAAAELGAAQGLHARDGLGKRAANGAAAVGLMASSFCSAYCCCPPWLTPETDKTAEQTAGSCCNCCSRAAPPQDRAHQVLGGRRRGRQSEPAFGNTAGATPAASAATAAVVCAGAAVRDMAAAAAAATWTGQQKHEQQTPPSRFRRRSWSAEVSHSAATTSLTTAAMTRPAVVTVTTANATAERTASSRHLEDCECNTSNAAGAATAAAEGQPSSARSSMAGVAAGATAAAASASTAAASAAEPCGPCLPGAHSSVSSDPASVEEADVLYSAAEGGMHDCKIGEGLGRGAADVPLGNSVHNKRSGQGKALGKASGGRAVDKGPNRGLDRGGGHGGSGGCVRYASLARISQGLLVGGSSLGRGSGLGIYACRSFSRRAVICEYSGILIDRRTALLLRHMECASHVVNVQMQHLYLLGFHTPFPLLGGGAFINDGRWNTRGRDGPGVCVRFRVMFDKHTATQRVVVVAVKDIPKGAELLTSYDNDYWRLQKGVHAQRGNM
ncbi:SET domain containing protein, putative [Eimeria praecox]|uniref:SET domain containing protein, putative n=1 Tax=Eimeria praecox TaxID=51316 RepID=U6H0V0_9EIME|nr:SET domain containing protein, putative [Eimeria praecox]